LAEKAINKFNNYQLSISLLGNFLLIPSRVNNLRDNLSFAQKITAVNGAYGMNDFQSLDSEKEIVTKYSMDENNNYDFDKSPKKIIQRSKDLLN
jgi:hypothetical protein